MPLVDVDDPSERVFAERSVFARRRIAFPRLRVRQKRSVCSVHYYEEEALRRFPLPNFSLNKSTFSSPAIDSRERNTHTRTQEKCVLLLRDALRACIYFKRERECLLRV